MMFMYVWGNFFCSVAASLFSYLFCFSSRRRHTIFSRDWSSDVCSSDLSPPRCPARRIPGSSLGAFAVSQELQQIGPGEDAQRLAVLRHNDCGSVLELGEGRLQWAVELDHGKGWGHDLGHVGLERVGVAEDAIEERSLPDRTNEGAHLERGLPDHRGLGDAESLKPIDGLADLLVGAHRDKRWDLAMLGREDLFYTDRFFPLQESVLEHPRLRVNLREIVAAGVGEDHHDQGVPRELPRHRERGEHGRAR